MAFRKPDFGNAWRTEIGRVVHRNLSGAPRFITRAIQPVIDGFDMTVSLVSRADLDTFIASLISTAGTSLTYIDFEGTVWSGFWETDKIAVRRGRAKQYVGHGTNTCLDDDYQVSFSFRGTHA